MDYERIYNDLIAHRQKNVLSTGYVERHHILPRSLGGSNDKENVVSLSGREHYIAHLLLARFNRCKQTVYSLWMMQMKTRKDCDRPCIKSGRMYEWARTEFIKYMSKNAKITSKGERNSQYGTRWICNLELKQAQKIGRDEPIPLGWILGRNKWNVKTKKIKPINPSILKKEKPNLELHTRLLWNEFNNGNYVSINSFSKIIGISQQLLCQRFSKYIDEYKGRKGKCYSSMTLGHVAELV